MCEECHEARRIKASWHFCCVAGFVFACARGFCIVKWVEIVLLLDGTVDMVNTLAGKVIEEVKNEVVRELPELLQKDLRKIILFGSYARGDCSDESDIDIAVLVEGGRSDSERCGKKLVSFSADMDIERLVVVNFICLPYREFNERKSYYPFFSNIDKEGIVLYGR